MSTPRALADDIRWGCDIIAWCREAVRFKPDPWQSRVLTSTYDQVLLNVSRQAGKSTVVGMLAAHMAIYKPGCLILLISRGLRQATELYAKVAGVLHRLGVKLIRDNQASSELANGSRIMSLPGDADSIRGFSPDLVVFDEAAFVPDGVYNSVRPMLSVSRGRLFLISTPNGQTGFFFDEWHTGGPHWHREQVTAHECPRISAEFLDGEQRRRGIWFAQEYMCSFEDGSASLFSHDLIQSLFSEPFAPLKLKVFT